MGDAEGSWGLEESAAWEWRIWESRGESEGS